MEKVAESVVGHVDGRVTQTLNKELLVPRKLGSKTV